MSLAELGIICVVALLVIGPKQMPMVARHLGKLIRMLTQLKAQAEHHWATQMKALQLLDNEEKASQADKQYQSQSQSSSGNRSTNE